MESRQARRSLSDHHFDDSPTARLEDLLAIGPVHTHRTGEPRKRRKGNFKSSTHSAEDRHHPIPESIHKYAGRVHNREEEWQFMCSQSREDPIADVCKDHDRQSAWLCQLLSQAEVPQMQASHDEDECNSDMTAMTEQLLRELEHERATFAAEQQAWDQHQKQGGLAGYAYNHPIQPPVRLLSPKCVLAISPSDTIQAAICKVPGASMGLLDHLHMMMIKAYQLCGWPSPSRSAADQSLMCQKYHRKRELIMGMSVLLNRCGDGSTIAHTELQQYVQDMVKLKRYFAWSSHESPYHNIESVADAEYEKVVAHEVGLPHPHHWQMVEARLQLSSVQKAEMLRLYFHHKEDSAAIQEDICMLTLTAQNEPEDPAVDCSTTQGADSADELASCHAQQHAASIHFASQIMTRVLSPLQYSALEVATFPFTPDLAAICDYIAQMADLQVGHTRRYSSSPIPPTLFDDVAEPSRSRPTAVPQIQYLQQPH